MTRNVNSFTITLNGIIEIRHLRLKVLEVSSFLIYVFNFQHLADVIYNVLKKILIYG